MAKLDLVLFAVFGTLCLAGVAGMIICLRQAMRVSGQRDGDVKMFFWAAGAMMCLIAAGMSAGYFLLPILLHR
jgi:hypothetical protein